MDIKESKRSNFLSISYDKFIEIKAQEKKINRKKKETFCVVLFSLNRKSFSKRKKQTFTHVRDKQS